LLERGEHGKAKRLAQQAAAILRTHKEIGPQFAAPLKQLNAALGLGAAL
jgi:hypothetical protein